jgi:hypothetical protein
VTSCWQHLEENAQMVLSAISLLGRIAELIAKYLQSKRLARDADKRGQACNSIVRLYYLLVDLKSLAAYIAEAATVAVREGNPSLLAYTFRDTKRRIESTSKTLSRRLTRFITHSKFSPRNLETRYRQS